MLHRSTWRCSNVCGANSKNVLRCGGNEGHSGTERLRKTSTSTVHNYNHAEEFSRKFTTCALVPEYAADGAKHQ